jgi:hypothetical protein
MQSNLSGLVKIPERTGEFPSSLKSFSAELGGVDPRYVMTQRTRTVNRAVTAMEHTTYVFDLINSAKQNSQSIIDGAKATLQQTVRVATDSVYDKDGSLYNRLPSSTQVSQAQVTNSNPTSVAADNTVVYTAEQSAREILKTAPTTADIINRFSQQNGGATIQNMPTEV